MAAADAVSFVGSVVRQTSLDLDMIRYVSRDEHLPLTADDHGVVGTAATAMSLITYIVGAGVLALPKLYSTVGIPFGLVLTAAGCCTSMYLCCILSDAVGVIQTATKKRMRTLEDVGGACYGELGRRVTGILINSRIVGKLAVYFVLIGQNLAFLRSPPMYRGWVVLGSGFFMTLAFVRSAKTLQKVAFLGVICSAMYLVMIVLGSIEAQKLNLSEGTDFLRLTDIDRSELLPAVSVMLFCFGPTTVIGNLRANMIHQDSMSVAVISSHTVVAIFYAIAASLGFWSFGAGVADDITQSMVSGGAKWMAGYLLAAAVVCKLCVSIPIDLYCLFTNIEASYPHDAPMPQGLNVACRLGVVCFCGLVGLALPFFMQVLEIYCALLVVPVVIWLPLTFAHKAAVDTGIPRSQLVRCFDGFLFLLGLACMILGLYKSLTGFAEAYRTDETAANPFAQRWF